MPPKALVSRFLMARCCSMAWTRLAIMACGRQTVLLLVRVKLLGSAVLFLAAFFPVSTPILLSLTTRFCSKPRILPPKLTLGHKRHGCRDLRNRRHQQYWFGPSLWAVTAGQSAKWSASILLMPRVGRKRVDIRGSIVSHTPTTSLSCEGWHRHGSQISS